MKYAREKDWAALSPVVFPPVIFFVSRSKWTWAVATTVGFTPARSRRAAVASCPSVRSSTAIVRNAETFEERYSALPESTAASVRSRNPSSSFAPTARVKESTRPTRAGTRTAVNTPLRCKAEATPTPKDVRVPSTTTIRLIPPLPASSSGRKKSPAKRSGPRSAMTQNHR